MLRLGLRRQQEAGDFWQEEKGREGIPGRANNAHSTEQLSSKPTEEQRGHTWVLGKGEWQERRWEGGLGLPQAPF